MVATKQWRCDCGCDKEINPGEEFKIIEGSFYKKDHEKKYTKMPNPKNYKPLKKNKYMRDCIRPCTSIHKTKEEAESDKEHFDGKTTEN